MQKSDVGSQEYLQAQKKLRDEISHREHVDYSINLLGKLLLGHENGSKILKNVRSPGEPLVDDWDCLKTLVIKPSYLLYLYTKNIHK